MRRPKPGVSAIQKEESTRWIVKLTDGYGWKFKFMGFLISSHLPINLFYAVHDSEKVWILLYKEHILVPKV